jgi:hypothetical protein
MKNWRYILAIAGLLLLNGWAYLTLGEARQGAIDAVVSDAEAESLAERIVGLRNRQSVASVRVVSESDLIRRVEQAAKGAQIPATKLLRITPESPRRFQEGAYLEQPIDLAFQEITLVQLVRCLLDLCEKNEGLSIQTLRLTAPRQGASQELWKVEATISYWIYSPKNESNKQANTL